MLIVTAIILAAAGCQDIQMPTGILDQINAGKDFLGLQTETPTSTTSTVQPQLTPEATLAIEIPVQPVLTLWLPPEFDPQSGSASGQLLSSRIAEFQKQNSGIQVNTRIKATEGVGGSLDMLRTASKAAPLALPSLVLLKRASFEQAVEEQLIIPVPAEEEGDTDPDWYPYAKAMGLVNEIQHGYPFIGDAMILVHRPVEIERDSLSSWTDILEINSPLLFPAADERALLTLGLYLSKAGSLYDENQRLTLDEEVMRSVLTVYQNGSEKEIFPYWLSQFDDDNQTWKAYHDDQGDVVVTWTSLYLNELPVDSSAVPLRGIENQPFTLADGWVWAISEPDVEQQELATQMAQFLVEPSFLAKFTISAGYLPVRPSTTSAVTDQIIQNLLEDTASNAMLIPGNGIFDSFTMNLRDAILSIIKEQTDSNSALELLLRTTSLP